MSPSIAALIVAHPARMGPDGLLMRALRSVAAQTLQPSEILVVNDVDRRGAAAMRQKLLGIAAGGPEWVAWLDSDDEWQPDHLEKLYKVAVETDSVYVYSWFHGNDPLGHFGLPFNPCQPHHTTMNVLETTLIAVRAGFPDELGDGRYANEDWYHICRVAQICCNEGLKMTHLPERTWTYHQHGQNTSGKPGQGDA